nr:MAG TPA: hypothetical protein [Caudoviricetes sp.]
MIGRDISYLISEKSHFICDFIRKMNNFADGMSI